MEADLGLPVLKGLRRVHAVNFFTHQRAVFVKWKHYLTSDTWSRPVMLIAPADVEKVEVVACAWSSQSFPSNLVMKELTALNESL